MPIKFNCPSCSAAIKAPDTHAGQTLPCPKCGQPVVVAAAPAPTAVTSSPTPPTLPQVEEPEPIDEVPEIITRDSRTTSAPPPVSSVAPAPTGAPPTDAFAAPQTRSERPLDVNLQDVRIVDLKLPFGSVFKFSVQLVLSNFLLIGVVYGVILVIGIAIFALLGLS